MTASVRDRDLERHGRRLGRTGTWWLAVGLAACVPGVAALVIGLAAGVTWLWAVGIAAILLGGGPAVIGAVLVGSAAVSRWSARHKSFA